MDMKTDYEAMISTFVNKVTGLDGKFAREWYTIIQKVDQKSLSFCYSHIDEAILRDDSKGESFLQVNFRDGRKILITENLIGFKPFSIPYLDMNYLPKVVTTPDLKSVLETIEDSLSSDNVHKVELDVLRKVFASILEGGHSVGFDLKEERVWLERVITIANTSSVA